MNFGYPGITTNSIGRFILLLVVFCSQPAWLGQSANYLRILNPVLEVLERFK